MAKVLRQLSIFSDATGLVIRVCAEWTGEIKDGDGNSVDVTPTEDIDDDLPIADAAEHLRSLVAARGAPKMLSTASQIAGTTKNGPVVVF